MKQVSFASETQFERLVRKKYNVYNSIFLNLPFKDISSVGMMIPLMAKYFNTCLQKGMEPVEIMDSYFGIIESTWEVSSSAEKAAIMQIAPSSSFQYQTWSSCARLKSISNTFSKKASWLAVASGM